MLRLQKITIKQWLHAVLYIECSIYYDHSLVFKQAFRYQILYISLTLQQQQHYAIEKSASNHNKLITQCSVLLLNDIQNASSQHKIKTLNIQILRITTKLLLSHGCPSFGGFTVSDFIYKQNLKNFRIIHNKLKDSTHINKM